MRTDLIKMAMHNQAFMVENSFLDKALSIINDGATKDISVSQVANENVVYEAVSGVAIISIDGAMYKKDMSGACGETVVSYTNIIKAIKIAENDSDIHTILFRVDTPGGSVAGADEVENIIYESTKKTITLFENLGASGGMYIFTASDEVYSTQNTLLGSIGVIMTFMESEDDRKVMHMTSKNAENKVCDIEGDCMVKVQERLDTYEQRFYELLIKNTGQTAKAIKSVFNNGDVVFAHEALNGGFIDDIRTFKEVLNRAISV